MIASFFNAFYTLFLLFLHWDKWGGNSLVKEILILICDCFTTYEVKIMTYCYLEAYCLMDIFYLSKAAWDNSSEQIFTTSSLLYPHPCYIYLEDLLVQGNLSVLCLEILFLLFLLVHLKQVHEILVTACLEYYFR